MVPCFNRPRVTALLGTMPNLQDVTSSDPALNRSGESPEPRTEHPKIAICIVAYNAASTLSGVLDRIPEEVWNLVAEVCVFDDSSADDTYLVGLGYKADRNAAKLSIFRNQKNLGYGGNQIRGYQHAITQGYDIVALLPRDGQ